MVVPGGWAVSYERGTPVTHTPKNRFHGPATNSPYIHNLKRVEDAWLQGLEGAETEGGAAPDGKGLQGLGGGVGAGDGKDPSNKPGATEPSTHLIPKSRNLKHQTPNPKPQTPNPKP